jgi:ABC-type Fe3+ transport system permease subunit
MKRLLRIFELSKNEQRVVLIVVLLLITIALVGYERRIHRSPVQGTSATEPKLSPTPAQADDSD